MMRVAGMIGIEIAGATMAISPAVAQLKPRAPTGSHIFERPTIIAKEQAGRIYQDFARCVYTRNPVRVDQLIRSSDMVTFKELSGSFSGNGRKDTLQLSDCLGLQADLLSSEISFKMPERSMRSFLVEAAYTISVKHLPVDNGVSPAHSRSFSSTGADLATATAMAELADCVVGADPTDADALVRLVPNSAGEIDQARKLTPALGGCVRTGQTFRLNAATVRMIVADGLWQRYVASAAPTGNVH